MADATWHERQWCASVPALPAACIKQRTRHFWEAEARHYDPVDAGQQGHLPAWQAWLTATIGPAPRTVLDVGVGTGFLALPLAALGHRVLGLDQAAQMLAIARQKALRRNLALALHQGDTQ